MTAKCFLRKKTLYSSIFCFLLIFVCISNISYADNNGDMRLLAIGIHYSGQPDTTWVVKEVTDSPVFAIREGQIQTPVEMGIAGDLSAGTADKIAFKFLIAPLGGTTQRGWDTTGDLVDQEMPPDNIVNWLTEPGGSPITLEGNSNKKFIIQLSTNTDPAVVITDM